MDELLDQQLPELGVVKAVVGGGQPASLAQLGHEAVEDGLEGEVVAVAGPRVALGLVGEQYVFQETE